MIGKGVCVAACWVVMQCDAVCCSVLQCVAVVRADESILDMQGCSCCSVL